MTDIKDVPPLIEETKDDEPNLPAESKEGKSERLWSEAYENLRGSEEKMKMVTTYEKALTKLACKDKAFAASAGFKVPDSAIIVDRELDVSQTVKAFATSIGHSITGTDAHDNLFEFYKEKKDRKLRMDVMRAAAKLVIDQTHEHAKTREFFITGSEVLDAVKEPISSALNSYPPAGLAFSGLCASLPVGNTP
jgi:hypothetical protein